MNKDFNLIDWSKIIAKVGLLFANCDGEYTESEQKFINMFIDELLSATIISENDKKEIEELMQHNYTLDEITKDIDKVLATLNKTEQEKLLSTLNDFIAKVINADGKILSKETELFDIWKKHFNITNK